MPGQDANLDPTRVDQALDEGDLSTYHESKEQVELVVGGSNMLVVVHRHAHTLHFICLWAAQVLQHFGHGHFGAF
jgi:hypothetical protein